MSRINELKTKVSLVDFIQSKPELGFRISDKSKKNKLVLYREIPDDSGNLHKSDTMVISRFNNSRGEMFDYYFEGDSGWGSNSKTIIDFVHEYVLNNFPEDKVPYHQVFGVLEEYMRSSDYVSMEESNWDLKVNKSRSPRAPIENPRDFIKAPTKETFDYLKSRHIDQETYFNPIFLSTYGSHTHVVEKENESDKIYLNPVFLFLNERNKVQTFQQIVQREKGRDKYFFKGSDRASGLFKSAKSKNTNTIVLTESPEDSMAHYQLSKEQFQQKEIYPYYLASGGNLGEEQIKHIASIVNENKFPIIFGYDRDKSGEKYTLNVLSEILAPDFVKFGYKTINQELHLGISINPKVSAISLSENQFMASTKLRESLIGLYSTLNRNETLMNGQTTYVKYTPEIFEKLTNLMSDILKKKHDIHSFVHVPVKNDWAADLERKNMLKREVHIHPRINIESLSSISRFRGK